MGGLGLLGFSMDCFRSWKIVLWNRINGRELWETLESAFIHCLFVLISLKNCKLPYYNTKNYFWLNQRNSVIFFHEKNNLYIKAKHTFSILLNLSLYFFVFKKIEIFIIEYFIKNILIFVIFLIKNNYHIFQDNSLNRRGIKYRDFIMRLFILLLFLLNLEKVYSLKFIDNFFPYKIRLY